MKRPRFFRGAWASVLLLALSCAPVPHTGGVYPSWPYPSLEALTQGPLTVVGYPDGLSGGWLVTDPYRNRVLLESRDPRYFAGYAPGGVSRGWYDLGPGTRVESMVPSVPEEWLMVARYYGGQEDPGPVTARSFLELRLSPPLVLGSVPLAVDKTCRGLAFDSRKNRAFLVQSTEDGVGSLDLVDLYRGRITQQVFLGAVPFGVGRRGVAFSPSHLELGVLVGGDPGVADFAPRDREFQEEAPRLLLLSSESLKAVEQIELPKDYEPQAVVYSRERGELVVLVAQVDQSLVMTVNLDFHSVQQIVQLSGRAQDLALVGQVAVVPTDRGLFYVDLGLGSFEVVSLFQTDRTGEVAVSTDGRTAWMRVFEFRDMDQPGVVEFDLVSRTASEVLP